MFDLKYINAVIKMEKEEELLKQNVHSRQTVHKIKNGMRKNKHILADATFGSYAPTIHQTTNLLLYRNMDKLHSNLNNIPI